MPSGSDDRETEARAERQPARTADSDPRAPDPGDHDRVQRLTEERLFGPTRTDEDAAPRVGRFRLLRRVGAGAMGIVYAAYDEELDRRLAIKLLRGGGGDQQRSRVRREAQAMARLNHPNVVAVYDVGIHEGAVFIAMEFVKGGTLRQWLHRDKHGAAEILDSFIQAGHGLAAAHRAGIVHRDFKPENVLRDEAGRARVVDFGLAHRDAAAPERDELPTPKQDVLSLSLTATGAVIGTPAYMAPEQLSGERTDARSDQFAFCVSLWEALHGQRPFRGETLRELAASVTAGRCDPPPKTDGVPGWATDVLQRGLSLDPADRFPDMDALLVELSRDRLTRRRTAATTIGAVAVLGIVGVATWVGQQHREVACSGAGAEIAERWTPRREALQAGLSAIDVGFASDTANRVAAILDEYADDWANARREACEATLIRGEQPDSIMAASNRCLDRRLRSFEAIVDALGDEGPGRLEHAIAAATQLPAVASCLDATFVSAAVEPPPDEATAQQVDTLRGDLARVDASYALSDYAGARALAEETVERATALGYAPVEVEARDRLAQVQRELGDFDAALATAQAAYLLSHLASQVEAARNHIELSRILTRKGRLDDGLREGRKAIAVFTDALGPTAAPVGLAHNGTGQALMANGDYAEAIAEFRLALEIWTAAEAPPLVHEYDRSIANLNLCVALTDNGQYEEALAAGREAVAAGEAVLGPGHPVVGRAHGNVGVALANLKRYDEAQVEIESSRDILTAAFGPAHESVANTESNLGLLLSEAGRHDEALPHLQISLESRRAALGPRHAKVGETLVNIGLVASRQGHDAEARSAYREALEIFEATLPPDHPYIAVVRHNLGEMSASLGDYEGAAVDFEAALAIRDKSFPEGHPLLRQTRLELGVVDLILGRKPDALALFRRMTDAGEVLDDSLRCEVIVWRALAEAAVGHWTEARTTAEEAEAIASRHPDDEQIGLASQLATLIASEDAPTQAVQRIRDRLGAPEDVLFARYLDRWLSDH